MLGTTLWLVVAIGLMGGVLIDLAGAFGRTAVHAAADHAIEAALHDGLADYQNQLAAAHAAGAPPPGLQRTYQSSAGDAALAFTLEYEVDPTTLTMPSCASAAPSDGPDTVGWLQCNAFVAESRVSLRVIARVRDAAGGAVLAQREEYVTLRLFGEPPYSAPVGAKDSAAGDPASSDPLTAPGHEGDAGGDSIAGPSPPPAPTPWPAGGTLIHVRYECHDGAGTCANAAPPDPDGDLRARVHWQNGNRPAP